MGIVQDRQYMLRADPTLYIDFLPRNPSCRLQQRLVLTATRTEFTFPMSRNLSSDRCRAQMSHVTKKLDRSIAVSGFHLPIRRTHATERLNAALNALRDPRPLAASQSQERVFPDLFYSKFSNTQSLLLRN